MSRRAAQLLRPNRSEFRDGILYSIPILLFDVVSDKTMPAGNKCYCRTTRQVKQIGPAGPELLSGDGGIHPPPPPAPRVLGPHTAQVPHPAPPMAPQPQRPHAVLARPPPQPAGATLNHHMAPPQHPHAEALVAAAAAASQGAGPSSLSSLESLLDAFLQASDGLPIVRPGPCQVKLSLERTLIPTTCAVLPFGAHQTRIASLTSNCVCH